jgi:hypothetical protein
MNSPGDVVDAGSNENQAMEFSSGDLQSGLRGDGLPAVNYLWRDPVDRHVHGPPY